MRNNLQTIENENRADLMMGEIISAPKIFSDTKDIGLSKAQALSSKTQVVRHKIYQIKPIQMITSQTTASNNSIKTNNQVPKKENEKTQEIKEKEIRGISNVFGQFFKVENLRNYSKPAQTDKVKAQQQNKEQKIDQLAETKTKIVTRTYQPRIISRTNPQASQLTELKILISTNESATSNKNRFQTPTIFPSQKEIFPISKILSQSVTEIEFNNNSDQSYVYANHNNQLHKGKKDQKEQIKQVRYSQPNFKLLEIETRSLTTKNEQNELYNNGGKQSKVAEPQINFEFSEIEENDKVENREVPQCQEFINNNDFTYPLLQCESRGSFPLYEPKVTISHHVIDENQIDFRKQQKTLIQLKPILSLGNLQPIQTQNQIVFTPSFHMEGTHSERKFIVFEDEKSNEEITPIKTLMQQFSKNSPQKKSQSKQSPIKPVINQSFNNNKKSSFSKIDDQVSKIKAIFVRFNASNTLPIDFLSDENMLESLSQVSSNGIQKQEEDKYINRIVGIEVQQQWRQRLFGGTIGNSKQYINKQTTFDIKLPQPTRSSSPSKYDSYMIDYKQSSSLEYNQTRNEINVLINNKTPLILPVIDQKGLNSRIKFDVDINNRNNNSESYVNNESKQILQLSTLPLESAQKHYTIDNRPSYPFNQSLTIEEQPSSIIQSIENPRSNIQQIQEIREFYNYLRSRESTYYDNQRENSPYVESLPQYEKRERKENERISRSMNKSYHNLHQIKNTSKPLITVQSARNYHIKNDLNEPHMMMNDQQGDIATCQQQLPSYIPTYKDQQPTTRLYSKQKKSLESIVLSFRRNNYIGDHKYFKDEVISLSQSRQIQQPHYSFIEQPKLSIFKDQIPIQANYVTFNINANEGIKSQFKECIQFPIEKIQPIKVMSMNKTPKQQKEIITTKSPGKNQENLTTSKKIKLVSVNFTPTSKPIQTLTIIKPQQVSSFLLNSFHNGSFMLNNAINNFIDTHTAKNNQVEVKNTNKKQNPLMNEVKKDEQNQLSSTHKKKIPLKKKNEISTKKLSINQKPYNKPQKTFKTSSSRSLQNNSSTKQSQFHKLCQTISKVNLYKEKELHQIIKSRITEKSNSQTSSLDKSPKCSKFNDQSLLLQNQAPLNEFKFYSKEICSSKGNNPDSHRKENQSNSKDYSLGKSKNSSKSSKKSGLGLWNSGLSELKSSRKLNREKQLKIFNQQNTRKDEKIIGITKWNENIAKYKQSRSKNKKSRIDSKQKRKQNKFGSQLIKTESTKKLVQQKMMNIEIKKYKHQVNNVQKKYFV